MLVEQLVGLSKNDKNISSGIIARSATGPNSRCRWSLVSNRKPISPGIKSVK